jgi:hypothetical protein
VSLCVFRPPGPLLTCTAHPSAEKQFATRNLSFNSSTADIFCERATAPGTPTPSSSGGTITTEPSCEGPTTYPFKLSFFFQGLLQAVQGKVLSDTKTPSASTAAFIWLLATKVLKWAERGGRGAAVWSVRCADVFRGCRRVCSRATLWRSSSWPP